MQARDRGWRLWLLLWLMGILMHAAWAQSPGGSSADLAAQLSRHYKVAMAKLSEHAAAVIQPVEVLTLRMDGLVGFSDSNQSLEEICPAQLRAGQLHSPKGPLCSTASPQGRKTFRTSDTVCPTAITTSESTNSVSIYLIGCNRGQQLLLSRAYYALLVIQLPKGDLHSATAESIEQLIGQVLSSEGASSVAAADAPAKPVHAEGSSVPQPGSSAPSQLVPPLEPLPVPAAQNHEANADVAAKLPDSSSIQSAQSVGDSSTSQSGSATELTVPPLEALPAPPVVEPQPQPAGETAIRTGMSPEQVRSILGAPLRIAEIGSKSIYFYPHLKVFFFEEKVSEIQQIEGEV